MKVLPLEQRIMNVLKGGKRLTATGIVKRATISRRERERAYRELERMKRAGKVVLSEEGYALASPAGTLIEAVVGNVHEKFGFVREPESGEEFFVPGRFLCGALPGDRVLLREKPARGELREGEVVRILEEGDYRFTGVFRRDGQHAAILPDTGLKTEIFVAPGQSKSARDGDKVVARVIRRGERHRDHRAQILLVAGSAQDARACAKAILAAQGVHEGFEEHLRKEAARLQRQGILEEDLEGRRDLREEQIFTIDSEQSKDLDDAVSLRRISGGWELGVHIADVSHYVLSRGALDLEAFERGTSIYYADQVIPMLPAELSNGICSLNEGEDRLALSVLMELDEDGALLHYTFFPSVIRSRVKGIYCEVNALLDGTASPEVTEKYGELCETLRQMDALAGTLRRRRLSRGAVELHSVESYFHFDDDGRILRVSPRMPGRAESLIEEFMLLANEAAASVGEKEKLPFLYRIHEAPSQQKVDALFDILSRLGITAQKPEGELTPGAVSALLQSVRGKELEPIVNSQILRSMAKARYSEENTGHFGLVLKRYSHFTSPIRRYPDLAIHRILHSWLKGESAQELHRRYDGFVHAAAEQSSARELRAMSIERECDSCFLAEYMSAQVGQEFPGVISSVAPHGFYVLLENSVEGLVHLHSLPEDTYDIDGAISLTARLSGRRYRVGDAVRVLVLRADVSSGQVDFSLADRG